MRVLIQAELIPTDISSLLLEKRCTLECAVWGSQETFQSFNAHNQPNIFPFPEAAKPRPVQTHK